MKLDFARFGVTQQMLMLPKKRVPAKLRYQKQQLAKKLDRLSVMLNNNAREKLQLNAALDQVMDRMLAIEAVLSAEETKSEI